MVEVAFVFKDPPDPPPAVAEAVDEEERPRAVPSFQLQEAAGCGHEPAHEVWGLWWCLLCTTSLTQGGTRVNPWLQAEVACQPVQDAFMVAQPERGPSSSELD